MGEKVPLFPVLVNHAHLLSESHSFAHTRMFHLARDPSPRLSQHRRSPQCSRLREMSVHALGHGGMVHVERPNRGPDRPCGADGH